jgi:hypothetical protein
MPLCGTLLSATLPRKSGMEKEQSMHVNIRILDGLLELWHFKTISCINEELHSLYRSPNIFRVITSRRLVM